MPAEEEEGRERERRGARSRAEEDIYESPEGREGGRREREKETKLWATNCFLLLFFFSHSLSGFILSSLFTAAAPRCNTNSLALLLLLLLHGTACPSRSSPFIAPPLSLFSLQACSSGTTATRSCWRPAAPAPRSTSLARRPPLTPRASRSDTPATCRTSWGKRAGLFRDCC